jgi:hypothetical protein
MIRRAEMFAVPVLLWMMVCRPMLGQAPAFTLKVELRNVVEYQVDTNDLSKYGTNPNTTVGGFATGVGCLGHQVISLGDIVSVNGQPAKGAYVSRSVSLCLTPTPVPGQPLADTTHNSMRYETYEILQSDGTPVGTVMTEGLNAGGPSPPGPSAGSVNFAIVGGTGAFLGARGQTGNAAQGLGGSAIPIRAASIAEDPANRRLNGGGHVVFTLYVIPMEQPQIVLTPGGPAVTHSNDFSLVSASKPAAAGEILSLFATGLGPTLPGAAPGQPFPSNPLAVVNSPVAVTVNGKAAQVLSAVGFPGATDGYQVNFQMPPDTTKGAATIQMSAAWIAGPNVSVPVQ